MSSDEELIERAVRNATKKPSYDSFKWKREVFKANALLTVSPRRIWQIQPFLSGNQILLNENNEEIARSLERPLSFVSSTKNGVFAGDVETFLTPGANKRWLVLGGSFDCLNDSTVGNRTMMCYHTTLAGTYFGPFLGFRITGPESVADTTYLLSFGSGSGFEEWATAEKLRAWQPVPWYHHVSCTPFYVDGTERLGMFSDVGFAGDQIGYQIKLLEFDYSTVRAFPTLELSEGQTLKCTTEWVARYRDVTRLLSSDT